LIKLFAGTNPTKSEVAGINSDGSIALLPSKANALPKVLSLKQRKSWWRRSRRPNQRNGLSGVINLVQRGEDFRAKIALVRRGDAKALQGRFFCGASDFRRSRNFQNVGAVPTFQLEH
jgi:hypothetical protein